LPIAFAVEELMPGINHVFVDYENMRRVDSSVFDTEGTTFTLLLGPQNRTLNVELVERLIARAAAVELVRIEEPGRNAVDFALTYYLGKKVMSDPTAQFTLISKDTGYDPLIKHLRGRNIQVSRREDFDTPADGSERPVSSTKVTLRPKLLAVATMREETPDATATSLIARVLAHLRRNANSRPKRQKTLTRQLASQFLKGAPGAEVERLIATLEQGGHLEINEKGAITYHVGGA
jgi:hypothetical protein